MDYKKYILEALELLRKDELINKQPFKARAYKNAIETIKGLPRVQSLKDVKDLPGIGKKIYAKIGEIIETGELQRAEQIKKDPRQVFQEIYGIGPVKAKELVEEYGITSIDELIRNQARVLGPAQRKGLQYYQEFQKRIPRSEMDIHKEVLECLLKEAIKRTPDSKGSRVEIAGSYRRGMMDSGDIDVLVTNPQDDIWLFLNFIEILKERGYLIHVFSKGSKKILGVAQLAPDLPARRIDLLWTTQREYPFALLYFTGSGPFNEGMRRHVNEMGYSLNEYGITNAEDGTLIDTSGIKDERDIFRFFDLKYVRPEDRSVFQI